MPKVRGTPKSRFREGGRGGAGGIQERDRSAVGRRGRLGGGGDLGTELGSRAPS